MGGAGDDVNYTPPSNIHCAWYTHPHMDLWYCKHCAGVALKTLNDGRKIQPPDRECHILKPQVPTEYVEYKPGAP